MNPRRSLVAYPKGSRKVFPDKAVLSLQFRARGRTGCGNWLQIDKEAVHLYNLITGHRDQEKSPGNIGRIRVKAIHLYNSTKTPRRSVAGRFHPLTGTRTAIS